MSHTGHREESIPIFNVHICFCLGPVSNGLIVIDRISGADELVGVSDIMDELPIALWTHKGGDIRASSL